MKIFGWTAALSLILVGWAGSASADPDKDESGQGRWRGGYERNYDGPAGARYGYERLRARAPRLQAGIRRRPLQG